MPRARKHLVCLSETPYYHVTSRCVRRAFLCGYDRATDRSYEHRRGWIEDRIRVLSSLFSIQICAYAVMSNHYHLVVRIDIDEPRRWADDDVLERWTALFKGPLLVQRHRNGEALSEAESETLRSIVTVYRSRLASLSWFMKCLNEPIARKANAEDRCTGHFWEARFHSEALCSDRALLTAMAYVDLNPIRAGMARTPESSEFTSIRARLQPDTGHGLREAVGRMISSGEIDHFHVPPRPLMPFTGSSEKTDRLGLRPTVKLPIRERDYLELVDAAGRAVQPGKRGRIDPRLAPVLKRIGFSTDEWLKASTELRKHDRSGIPRTRKTA